MVFNKKEDEIDKNNTEVNTGPKAFFNTSSIESVGLNSINTDDYPSFYVRSRKFRVCANCKVTKTPSWRKSPNGNNILCNACGLYMKLHGVARPFSTNHEGKTKAVKKDFISYHCSLCNSTMHSYKKIEMIDGIVCEKCYYGSRVSRYNENFKIQSYEHRDNNQSDGFYNRNYNNGINYTYNGNFDNRISGSILRNDFASEYLNNNINNEAYNDESYYNFKTDSHYPIATIQYNSVSQQYPSFYPDGQIVEPEKNEDEEDEELEIFATKKKKK